MTGPPAIGVVGWSFLLFAGLLLPAAALAFAASEARQSRIESDVATDAVTESRVTLYAQVLGTHALLFLVAVLAARGENVAIARSIDVGGGDIALSALALIGVIALGELSWRTQSPHARAQLWVRKILPRTPSERRLWVAVSAGAAIAEEVAYRGVFVTFAAGATGNTAVAIVVSAVVFAVVHAPQGLAGMGYVFVIALLHHALVLLTGTLLLAMTVHFTYDVVAGLWLAKRHGLVRA